MAFLGHPEIEITDTNSKFVNGILLIQVDMERKPYIPEKSNDD